jgi:alpha-L-rhamnosidase
VQEYDGLIHGNIRSFGSVLVVLQSQPICNFDLMPPTAEYTAEDEDSSVSVKGKMEAAFLRPPTTYGPVPFYWWAGEKLDRERIAWQLDRLCEKGVRQTVISYPHLPDGGSDLGDPALFSEDWWDLFRWFLSACLERGMTVGFQDYTLIGSILESIGRDTPGMQGGQMSCVGQHVTGNVQVRLSAEPASHVIGAWAYRMKNSLPDLDTGILLTEAVQDGVLEWSAPAGEWFVTLVFARLNPFDPLHPDAGNLAIDRLYAPFERKCPENFGKTFNLFFQDELDFGSRMPFWSNQLIGAFLTIKGYDLSPLLPALWHDMGPMTEKIRLDFADVVTRRMEECYFKPVWRWHVERGILFGNDNCGRGGIAEGRSHYGDYFRTMRWFSAPGCDDPKLNGARAFKGLKVNSSIAHLYRRPRVWVEAFHSSGWGTTPAEIVAAINEDFAYGATVVNLHGLYYSTRGGWWEWAPPDFHFRQPYWKHSGALNDYLTRVCWLLSQGVHRCDVAIIYPISALDTEPADPEFSGVKAHMGNEWIGSEGSALPRPEETAFGMGKYLFDHACDFDFIDFESLAKAKAGHGKLVVADASYQVLIFPAMKAVRMSMVEKARDFVHAGGLVIAFGCLPTSSDHMGRDDAGLNDLIGKIFGSADDSKNQSKQHPGGGVAIFFRDGYVSVLEAITGAISRDVTSSVPLQVLHRHLEDRDVYFVSNSSDESITADIIFRSEGGMDQWDAWTGKITSLSCSNSLTVGFAPREARVFVSNSEALPHRPVVREASCEKREQLLDGPWESQVHPVLDNRFGDFSLPATPGMLGPQARRFRYYDEFAEDAGWESVAYDDSDWPETTFSFGPQLECAGPFPPDTDFAEIEESLLGEGAALEWRTYAFSRRWGIERDPFLTDWLNGPHGLKGAVPDEFLDFQSDTDGSVWYLRAKVVALCDGRHTLVTGGRCAYQVWLNGQAVIVQPNGLDPGLHARWRIPHYECEAAEVQVTLRKGGNDLLVKLVQPLGQRTRAFVAFDPPQADPGNLALRWFTGADSPRPCLIASDERRAIRFRFMSPPGLREITFVSRGHARIWAGGAELVATPITSLAGGCIRYRVLIKSAVAEPQTIAIRVEAPADSHAGDALPEPVSFICGAGSIDTGDWCAQGLATYSGALDYIRSIFVPEIHPGRFVYLDLGKVAATAEVRVNGKTVATLLTPPWQCDLTPFLVPGENTLSITVANTLANHYSVGIPTPYAFKHQTPSGLFGPVTLITTS